MADMSDLNSEVASKRAEKTKRLFLTATGESRPRAGLDSVAGRIIFVGSNEVLNFAWDDLTPEVQRAAGLFGIMTSVTNTVGRKDMTEDEMIEAAGDRLATICDGHWSAERQSGPRNSDFIMAAERWYNEVGKQFDREGFTAKLNSEEEGAAYKAKLQSVPKFKAHLEAIRAERAAERARKAQANVAGSNDVEDLVNL